MTPLDPAIDPDFPDHIDQKVPPKVLRLTQHYHNLIYIRYFWETLGQQPPQWVKDEMVRTDRVLQEELISEHNQGGAFYETGKSSLQRPGSPESGTQAPRDVSSGGRPDGQGDRRDDPRGGQRYQPQHVGEHVRREGVQGSHGGGKTSALDWLTGPPSVRR